MAVGGGAFAFAGMAGTAARGGATTGAAFVDVAGGSVAAAATFGAAGCAFTPASGYAFPLSPTTFLANVMTFPVSSTLFCHAARKALTSL